MRLCGDRLALIPSVTRAGFTESGRLATPIFAFGASDVASLAFRLAPSRHQCFGQSIARLHRQCRYMCHRHFTW